MIDIHTHLLPGVDDGSPSTEHSSAVMRRLFNAGVRGIVCTPHLKASEAASAPVAAHRALLEELRSIAPDGLQLWSGFEIMLDTPGMDLTAADLGLGGSRARLVEFSLRGLPLGAAEELLRLRASGVRPVVAHPERYPGCNTEKVDAWREFGAAVQTDTTALLGGGAMMLFAHDLLAAGMVDVIASDNHGDRRSISTAREWLTEIGAREQAVLLTEENPARLLDDRPLIAVPPIPMQKGFLERLRELVRRGRAAATGEAGLEESDDT